MSPKTGDTVRVNYRGTLSDGTQFDSSEGRGPLEFTLGAGQVIPGFDEAVSELKVGDSVTITIEACDAYGDRVEEAIQSFPLDFFGGQLPEEGWMVELEDQEGRHVPASVSEVTADSVVLDFNHPLAGNDLTFEIELVEVVDEQ